VLDRVLPMEQLPAAFARMAAREVVGKLVLTNP
jgi:NADPH2:quinone reductase